MALFLALYLRLRFGFQRTAVSRHPALWSPDLPPVTVLPRRPAIVWPASGGIVPVKRYRLVRKKRERSLLRIQHFVF